MDCYKKWYDASSKCQGNHQSINYIISTQKPILRLPSYSYLINFKLNSISILSVLHLSDPEYIKLRDGINSASYLLREIDICFDEIKVIVDYPTSKSIVESLKDGDLILKFDGKNNVNQIVDKLDLDKGDRLKGLLNRIYEYVRCIRVKKVKK